MAVIQRPEIAWGGGVTFYNSKYSGLYHCIGAMVHSGPFSTKHLMTAGAKTATKRMVVLFAVRESFVLKKVPVVEGHLTLLAHKAVGVPLQVERGDVVLGDRGVAAAALGGELLEVAGLAERGVVLLVEPVVAELVAALGAEEVLRVEGLVEGRDALVQDWALAVTAPEVRMILRKKEEKGETRPWTKETVVVLLTVRSALSLKEVLGAQLLIDCGSSNHSFQSARGTRLQAMGAPEQ